MAATALDGNGNLMRRAWKLSRDNEGYREYHVTWGVHAALTDGPQTVMNATGLPGIGTSWSYGSDSDPWAKCLPKLEVRHAPGVVLGEATRCWLVDQVFSNKPLKRCQTSSIDNPLNEPMDISGSFVRFTKEVTRDRWDNVLETSSHQPLQGPDIEFDDGYPTVHIEQNVGSLAYDTCAYMFNKVNDRGMWGLNARCIKLSGISWQRLLYGTCTYYYRRIFDFDTNEKTFDRTTPDYSNIVLNGWWVYPDGTGTGSTAYWQVDPAADPSNPQDYIRFKDRNGENARVLLDGSGSPLGSVSTGTGTSTATADDDIVYIPISYYQEANLLLLGLPTELE